MVKKLQALKAKKGFTLVELVVVIAIIGVLAAILIPTMLGVVQDANITSANSTAQTIKTQATNFITKCDTAKASLTGVGTAGAIAKATITDGSWSIVGVGNGFGKIGNVQVEWSGTHAACAGGDDINLTTCMAAFMEDGVRELKNGYAALFIQSNQVAAVAVVEGSNTADYAAVDAITVQDFIDLKCAFGASKKAGITDDGIVVGTNPVLQLRV